MDSVSAAASSIQAVNDMMRQANIEALKAAEKLLKYNVSVAVGVEMGKGDQLDVSA
ncbi:MAG TPA: hypothetical protein PLE24_07725 [Chitinispirillaceae bacterium]|jgi:hypothetical protein|nr:hypothetical protein [Chitinispirillaceae bacterium]